MEELDEDHFAEADGDGGSGNEDGDEIEAMLEMRPKNTWSTAGAKKNEVVRELIKCFGSMVESHTKEYAIPDNKGKYKADDMVFEKLLDAPKYVAKAKRALILNENFDSREFSIFISSKRWIKTILRPLLELCAKDDSILAMRCCSLALVLIRRLSDASQKVLTEATRGSTRKASSLDLQLNEDDKEDEEKAAVTKVDVVADKEKEQVALMSRIENVKQQVSALLSFKEALCSDKCNEAIANAFKEFWLKEQVESSEDNKTGVAICFSYLRRILAIEAHAQWSSAGELQQHRLIHDRYIVQLRLLLSVLPGVCSDLLRSYHNDWLGDVILIIFFTLRGFEPKELYRVWRTGALIEDFENFDSYDADIDAEDITPPAPVPSVVHPALAPAAVQAPAKKVIDVVVPTSLAQANKLSAAGAGKGKLSQLLNKERNARVAEQAPSGGASRFRGVYQRTVAQAAVLPPVSGAGAAASSGGNNTSLDHILGPAPTAPAAGTAAGAGASKPTSSTTGTAAAGTAGGAPAAEVVEEREAPVVCIAQVAKILRNPFAQSGASIPQAQVKRNKKNLTFALDTTLSEAQNGSTAYLTSEEHQKATVVAATLANLLASELSLKPLVKRVNEDLRRDDMRVGQELELRYFDILYRVLHYNRLKLADEYRDHQTAVAAGGVERLWEPNLKNVMDALDRMSFTRVVTAVERVGKNAARAEDVVVPLCLYKEMVCYMRILLESDLEGHHEIAIAALHRLYYAASERLDPLPKLLSAWKSGTFPRRHLFALVELVHETLKTLEAAQMRFRPEGDRNAEEWAKKKYKRKGGKNEMDLEQYVMACMRFKPDDYFKKLVTNQTVRMYTKLLSHYAQNDSTVNYYAYCFLRRMNAFTLEQEYRTPAILKPAPALSSTATTASQLNTSIELQGSDQVSLAFMLFNFQTLEVFEKIINDRDAYDIKSMEPLIRLIKAILRRFGEAAEKNHMLYVEVLFQHQRPHEFCCTLDSVYEAPAHVAYTTALHKRRDGVGDGLLDDSSVSDKAASSSDDDLGDEFDENNISEAFKAQLSDKQKARLAKQKAREDRIKDKASHKARKDAKRAKHTDRMTVMAERLAPRVSRFAWSAEEDAILKTEYARYAGSRSVFMNIAQNPELKAFGMHRSEAQIAKRAKELNLHMQVTYSDGEDSDDELAILPPAAARSAATAGSAALTGTTDFRGIIFSDEDEGSDGGLGLDDAVPFSPLPPVRAGRNATAHGAIGDTQIDTQYDTQFTAFSAASPSTSAARAARHARAQAPHSGSAHSQASDFAGLFSPSDTSLNEDIEQEAATSTTANKTVTTSKRAAAAGMFSMSAEQATQSQLGTQSQLPPTASTTSHGNSYTNTNTNSTVKKARLVPTDSTRPAPTGRAAWDIDDDGPDLLEQRSMALARATGVTRYSSDEDNEPSSAAGRKANKRPAASANTVGAGQRRKGLKKPKTSSGRATVQDSDDEGDLFGTAAAAENETQSQRMDTAPSGGVEMTQQEVAAQKAALYKKRFMRIESDDEE